MASGYRCRDWHHVIQILMAHLIVAVWDSWLQVIPGIYSLGNTEELLQHRNVRIKMPQKSNSLIRKVHKANTKQDISHVVKPDFVLCILFLTLIGIVIWPLVVILLVLKYVYQELPFLLSPVLATMSLHNAAFSCSYKGCIPRFYMGWNVLVVQLILLDFTKRSDHAQCNN